MSTITATPLSELRMLFDDIETATEQERQEAAMLRAEIGVLAAVCARRKARSAAGRVFTRRATEISDEPGYWDTSYPPSEHVVEYSDERLLLVERGEESERPLTSGAYYDYEIVTTTPDLLVDADGILYHAHVSGTASYGPYAAHPGTDNRKITCVYRQVPYPTLTELRSVAETLREMYHA